LLIQLCTTERGASSESNLTAMSRVAKSRRRSLAAKARETAAAASDVELFDDHEGEEANNLSAEAASAIESETSL
jgi:hypothetical protein